LIVRVIDVNLGKDRVERLTVYDGEEPKEVAEKFRLKTGISEKMQDKLEKMLVEQLKSRSIAICRY
jgi:phosphoribosylaminoimidazole-succinocarboxamide synthase